MQGILANLPAALASAAHNLVLPFQAFWRWIHNTVAGGWDGVWPLIQRFVATAASTARELVPAFEALWRWLKDAAAVALPVVLAIAAVVCIAAIVWFFWPVLCVVAMVAGVLVAQALLVVGVLAAQALVVVICICGRCLFVVAMGIGSALAYLLPVCGQYLASATMAAPGVAGVMISRAAFKEEPRMYFQILSLAGPLVAAAVFSTSPLPWAVGLSVVALFSRRFSGGQEPTSPLPWAVWTPEEGQMGIHDDDQMWTHEHEEDQPVIVE
ncbi:hypothetical protein ZWY2020_018623 [Hordeum vulgare]|nr:hypothetical protein ZWY2020_018623 [Hordeum vulgare]